MVSGCFKCQCSEIPHEKCASSANALTQKTLRTLAKVIIELQEEFKSLDKFNMLGLAEYDIACWSLIDFVKRNTDEMTQACALSLIPGDLTDKYPLVIPDRDVSIYSKADADVYGLLQWFKNEFFVFIDNPLCPKCNGKMYAKELINSQKGYLFECPSCIPVSRKFVPRNFSLSNIYEAQYGYLDEAIMMFLVFLESLMVEARVVVTDTYYKWVEVYSETQKRWIHCDPVLGLFDSPLTYELTWGPFFNTCIALGTNIEFADVSRRYTNNYSELMKRRSEEGFNERLYLTNIKLGNFTHPLLFNGDVTLTQRNFERQKNELRQLISCEYAYGKAIDKSENRYLRIHGSTVLRSNEWLLTHKTEEPLFSFPDSNDSSKRIMAVGCGRILGDPNTIFLTPKVKDCVGAVWTQLDLEKVLSKGFVVEFCFKIDQPGADGFAFVIQGLGSNVIGANGCQLGYGGLHHSLAVEFDNFLSQDECNDPNPCHVGINTMYESPNTADHGRAGIATTVEPLQLADKWHKSTIAFMGKTILIWLDSRLILGTTECNIERILKGRDGCWAGFTAATGGLSQIHIISKWKMSYLK